jgi:hypothetical protein
MNKQRCGDFMKNRNHINALTLGLALITVACAPAVKKDPDFRPYLENPKQEQHAQWRSNPWQVGDWAASPASGQAQMDALFRAGVLQDFVPAKKDTQATLIVGQGFYHLSGFDKRRAVMLFDHLYNVTGGSPAVMRLQDGYTGRIVGMYDKAGLQLQ